MDQLLAKVSAWVAFKTGLCFPTGRNSDLERALISAAQELGIADVAAYVDSLLSGRSPEAHLQVLVRHLTVGETYFWRDRNAFDALIHHVLPELLRRRAERRELKLWSAACCTGEEAYSLAILVQQCVPDWREWRITILGTDINEVFLRRAAAGVYGEWSFRGVPAHFKACYFTRAPDGRYTILPQIARTVRFAHHNLIDEPSALVASRDSGVDLILCRNVLMYLTSAQARKVVANLSGVLSEDGWLIVGGSECSQILFKDFASVNLPGAILYRKEAEPAGAARREQIRLSAATENASLPMNSNSEQPRTSPAQPHRRPCDADVVATPLAVSGPAADAHPQGLAQRARRLANMGRLDEAMECCKRWIAADVLDSNGHYLQAMILQELGHTAEARKAFRQAIYLAPGLTLAHIGLGNLARAEGRSEQAIKHFSNALESLRDAAPDDPLQAAEGLTARRLQGILVSLLSSEAAL